MCTQYYLVDLLERSTELNIQLYSLLKFIAMKAKSLKGKDAWEKSRRNQVHSFESPLPVESNRMYVITPALNLDM